jgi:hypothetical protein
LGLYRFSVRPDAPWWAKGPGGVSTETTQDEGWRPGPAVFAIGWIPKVMPWQIMPRGFRIHRKWYSWKGMLTTGNQPPPREFTGPEDLKNFIEKKEFRAVVGFYDVKIRPANDDQDSHQATFTLVCTAGFTPLRIIPLFLKYHSEGDRADIHTGISEPGQTYFRRSTNLEFRVGRVLNFLHMCLTHYRLWNASVDVSYFCQYDGRYHVELRTTNIPNVTFYCDWKAVAEYSIENIAAEQVEDFLTAYRRRTPSESSDRFSITGRVGEAPVIAGPPLHCPDWVLE